MTHSSFEFPAAGRLAFRLPHLLVALLVAPLLLALAACGGESTSSRLARADAKYAIEVLEKAPEHGFAPGAFNIKAIQAAQEAKDPKVSALLRAAVIDYAEAQHGLAIQKRARPAAWGAAPPAYDAAAEMDVALKNKSFREWLDGQAPQTPLYAALQQAYVASLADRSPQGLSAQATLRANLERVRWLPREEPTTRVDVNIPAATLAYIVDGQPRMTMRTASGKPGDETPMLTSKIDHIVLNPPWNVPQGIATEELLPKGPEYLAANNFTTKDDGNLMQLPGPGSALGLVKFDFDNPYAVYLHDTPAKAAFDRNGRAVSHGCVRLERALDLANLVLTAHAGWSTERMQQVIAGGETTTVKLDRPLPVRLLYLTAVPGPNGVEFVPDVYGWDAQLLRLLDKATTTVPGTKT